MTGALLTPGGRAGGAGAGETVSAGAGRARYAAAAAPSDAQATRRTRRVPQLRPSGGSSRRRCRWVTRAARAAKTARSREPPLGTGRGEPSREPGRCPDGPPGLVASRVDVHVPNHSRKDLHVRFESGRSPYGTSRGRRRPPPMGTGGGPLRAGDGPKLEGTVRIGGANRKSGGTLRAIERTVVHPGYANGDGTAPNRNDIALVRLGTGSEPWGLLVPGFAAKPLRTAGRERRNRNGTGSSLVFVTFPSLRSCCGARASSARGRSAPVRPLAVPGPEDEPEPGPEGGERHRCSTGRPAHPDVPGTLLPCARAPPHGHGPPRRVTPS